MKLSKLFIIMIMMILAVVLSTATVFAYMHPTSYEINRAYGQSYSYAGYYSTHGGVGAAYINGQYYGPAFRGYGVSNRYGLYGTYRPTYNAATFYPAGYTQRLYGNYGAKSSPFEVYNGVDDHSIYNTRYTNYGYNYAY